VISRLARGLYQLPDAAVGTNHTLAEASKLVPKGVICLTSALAFHGLTDQMPARVWVAIGSKDWRPRLKYPPMRFAHFPPKQLRAGVEHHTIEGASVPIFSVCKTVADVFRYRRTIGIDIAIEGLREAIRQRKASPGEIARYASEGGVRWAALCAASQVSEFHVLFPGTRWIERFAQAGQKRLDAREVRATVRNLRTNPELRDGKRVQEANELSACEWSARHVGRNDRNAYPGERCF